MRIRMTDGWEIELLKIASTIPSDAVTDEVTIWRAEAVYPVHKMHSSFMRASRGFGPSKDAAIASLYEKLEDAGELENDILPCEDCGKGYRLLSVVSTQIPHDEKCPAMNDTGET